MEQAVQAGLEHKTHPKKRAPIEPTGFWLWMRNLAIGLGGLTFALGLYALTKAGLAQDVRLAKLPILLHIASALPAIPLGIYVLLRPKGDKYHKRLGKLWCALMFVAATSTLFIQESNPGHYSWIHIFVPITYFGLFALLLRIRRKDVVGHQRAVIGLFLGGLAIAGILTFTPGRLLGNLLFS
jgi:uncharacterized membrane protein